MSAENPQSIREVISQFVNYEREFKRRLEEAYKVGFGDLVRKIGRKRRDDIVIDRYDGEPSYFTIKDTNIQPLKEALGGDPFLERFDVSRLVDIQMSSWGQIEVIDRERKIAGKVELNMGEVEVSFGLAPPSYFRRSEVHQSPLQRVFLVRNLMEAAEQIISERLTPQPVSQ